MNNIHTEIEDLVTKVIGAKLKHGEWEQGHIEAFTKAIEALLLDAQAEGYKRGYIAGGIEEFNKGQKNE